MKQKDTEEVNRQITSIKITDELTAKIGFNEIIPLLVKGDEGDDIEAISNDYSVKSGMRVHDDLLDAMNALRKIACDLCGIEPKPLNQFAVVGIKISGDMLMNTSRVVLTVSKETKYGKDVEFKTPQIIMYGESEYPKSKELSQLIELVVEEAWKYIGGKYGQGHSGQLSLAFSLKESEVA